MDDLLKKYMQSALLSNYVDPEAEERKRKRLAKRESDERLLYGMGKLGQSIAKIGGKKETVKPDRYNLDKASSDKKLFEAKSLARKKELLGLVQKHQDRQRQEAADKRDREFEQGKFEYQKQKDAEDRKLKELLAKYKANKKSGKKGIKDLRSSAAYKAGYKIAEKSAMEARGALDKINVFSAELAEVERLAKSGIPSEENAAYRQADQMLRKLNTLGSNASDAVGKEEVERLAPELRRSLSNVIDLGSLRDIDAFVKKVQRKIKATGIANEHLYNRSMKELKDEKFGEYVPSYYGRQEKPKQQYKTLTHHPETGEELKAGDTYIDPETGIEMRMVEE